MLLRGAEKGIFEAGAEVVRFDFFRLNQYTGCVSCFSCKKNKFKGHCIKKDGLTPVLDYSATDWEWSLFDFERKLKRRQEVFPFELQKAYELGKVLIK